MVVLVVYQMQLNVQSITISRIRARDSGPPCCCELDPLSDMFCADNKSIYIDGNTMRMFVGRVGHIKW